MENYDYIIGIDKVNDIKSFFESLLSFYASINVILTTWGKLPSEVTNRLSSCKARTNWFRGYMFHEINWHLNNETVNPIIELLCTDSVLDNFTWGLHKGQDALGLCRSWDDMNVNGSDLVKKAALIKWVEKLKTNGIIECYEIITD